MINLILSVDIYSAIGWSDGRLAFRLKADLARFKSLTTGSTVFMGSRTFRSLGRLDGLPGRHNIVLTQQPYTEIRQHIGLGVDVVSSLDWLDPYRNGGTVRNVWVIGGASVFDEALRRGLVGGIYLTLVHDASGADVCLTSDLANWKTFMIKEATLGRFWTVDVGDSQWDTNTATGESVETTYVTLKKILQ